MMSKALPLVHFWSILLLKEQMMTSVRKMLKRLVWSAQNRLISSEIWPQNRPLFGEVCPENSHEIGRFFREFVPKNPAKFDKPFASAEGCTNFCPPKNENVPQNFSQRDKLSPSDQILAQTLDNAERFKIIGGCNDWVLCCLLFRVIEDFCEAPLFFLTEPHLLTLQCCQWTQFARFYDLE